MGIVKDKLFSLQSRGWMAAIVACVVAVAGLAVVANVRPAGSAAGPSGTGLLIVATSNDTQHRNGPGYLTLIDPSTAKIVGRIPDGGVTAHEIIISSDGRKAFAPLYGNAGVGVQGTDGSTISVIDIASEKQVGTIDYGHGVRPHFGVRGPDGTIYVTTELDHAVSMIDPKTDKVVGSLPTGQPESHSVAVSHDGKHAYTSNVMAGTVSVMDVKERKLTTVIPISTEGFYSGLDAKNPWRAWKVQRISISPDDQTVFTCDWPKSQLVAISTATNSVKGRVQLSAPCFGETFTPDGKYAAVVGIIDKRVFIVDVPQMKVVKTIEMPSPPQEDLMRPDGKEVYVSCHVDNGPDKIVFIRTSDWTIDHTVDTGYFPDGLAWTSLSAKSLHPGQ